MSGRPKHVSALSDKISGLKFMQRARAVQEQSQSEKQRNGESSSQGLATSAIGGGKGDDTRTLTNGAIGTEDGNDEHWVLPTANTTPSLKRKASESSVIIHEPGWNAWLIDADGDTTRAGKKAEGSSTRRVFGSWAAKRAKKQKESSEGREGEDRSKRGKKSTPDGSAASDGSDEDGDDSEAMRALESSGFVKPGTLPTKSGKGKSKSKSRSPARAGSESSQSSVRGGDPAGSNRSKGGQGRKEKKRNNTNGRPLLSGFSNFIQSDKKKQK